MQIDCISEYEKIVKRFSGKDYNHPFFSDSTDKFKITKHKEGIYPAIVTISGFWSEDEDNKLNWQNSISNAFPNHEWFHIEWNTQKAPLKKYNLDKVFKANSNNKVQGLFIKFASFSRKYLSIVHILINNDWHLAVRNSRHTGRFLGDIMSACGHKEFILIGHSLGARVIHNCLEHISKKGITTNIKDVYLLGGAVSSRNSKWKSAMESIQNNAYNYYSKNDIVLREAYASIMIDDYPVGLNKVSLEKFINIDSSKYISGHTEYIPNFHIIKNK